jgi:hypothetical protein
MNEIREIWFIAKSQIKRTFLIQLISLPIDVIAWVSNPTLIRCYEMDF